MQDESDNTNIKYFKNDNEIFDLEFMIAFADLLRFKTNNIITNLRELTEIIHKSIYYYLVWAKIESNNKIFFMKIDNNKDIALYNNENIELVFKYYDDWYKILFISNERDQSLKTKLGYVVSFLSMYFEDSRFIALSYKYDIDKYKKEIESQLD